MKDDNLAQKEKNENSYQDASNKIMSSPKLEQRDIYFNLLSPEKTMNQKFFPTKENYFGIKTSPINNMGRSISPGTHSPILNYYAGISPHGDSYYSPKNELDNNNIMSNNFSGKLSPNFNYSPSHIFNIQNTNNKDIRTNIQNFKMQNNFNNNEDDSKTLQEKMAPFVGKTDVNNFLMGSFPSNMNNLEENKNEHQDEEDEDDDNEEAFTLKIDDFEDDFVSEANKQKAINQASDIIQKRTSKSSNEMNINNNILPNINNNVNGASNTNINLNVNPNEQINQNNNNNTNLNLQKQPDIKEKQMVENNDNDNDQEKESLVKIIINKKEFKPYIPNKYRNQIQNVSNIPPNINEKQIIPPYEGNNSFQNFQNNNNININFEQDKMEQYINYPNINVKNKFSINLNQNNEYNIEKTQSDYDNENLYNNFFYNGDNYKISNFKEYKKKDYLKTGEIPSISAADIVTAITANNKKIKRIDPNAYLNESIEYLSYNIFPLAKDQAGCRFLQEKLEIDPINTAEAFYKAILPFVLPLVKDPFGNYLIQKLFNYISQDQLKTILEIMTPTILDIGSNSHGTRVIQNMINYLKTKELVNCFLKCIKPYVIPLLKELNGTHIINKFVYDHPECSDEINKIIIENSSLLATHRHGCCILQKMLESRNKKFRNNLINNLIENCFVLIIDQFGNYVIQSILLLNDNKASSEIAMKICDNVAYYSKHRYSSNVIEKCFDFCGRKEKKKLIEKIASPEIISELILDEHGNYVVQKALSYADYKDKEIIINYIKPLIPKIKSAPFGEKLLFRLYTLCPQLNPNIYSYGNNNNLNDYIENNNNDIYFNNKGNKKKGKKKKKNNNTNNKNNFINEENNEGDNNDINNNNQINNNDNNNEINKNVSLNNYYNINNNTINININSNNTDTNSNSQIEIINNDNIVNNHTEQENVENNIENNTENNTSEPKKKKKKKKGKKKKKKIKEIENAENNENFEENSNINTNENNTEQKIENDINENNLENANELNS